LRKEDAPVFWGRGLLSLHVWKRKISNISHAYVHYVLPNAKYRFCAPTALSFYVIKEKEINKENSTNVEDFSKVFIPGLYTKLLYYRSHL
jgi:hypothetical protein